MGAIDQERMTHALNVEGIFFQSKCAKEVEKAGFELRFMEYPVSYPKNKPIEKTVESTLDIFAEKIANPHFDSKKWAINLLIECKKANPKFKDWVFFKKIKTHLGTDELLLNATMLKNIKRGKHWKINFDKIVTKEPFQYFEQNYISVPPDIKNPIRQSLDICYDGRELKGDYEKKNAWKSSTERIQSACMQISIALRSFMFETFQYQFKLFFEKMDPDDINYYIPIIITTANLFTVDYKIKDIDLGKGEIEESKPKFDSVPWLVYEYPLESYLQLKTEGLWDYHLSDREKTRKLHIFIVNSKALLKFLSLITPENLEANVLSIHAPEAKKDINRGFSLLG